MTCIVTKNAHWSQNTFNWHLTLFAVTNGANIRIRPSNFLLFGRVSELEFPSPVVTLLNPTVSPQRLDRLDIRRFKSRNGLVIHFSHQSTVFLFVHIHNTSTTTGVWRVNVPPPCICKLIVDSLPIIPHKGHLYVCKNQGVIHRRS